MVMRVVGALAVALALGSGTALGQEVPIAFIKVADVNRLLLQGRRVQIVDVRSAPEYTARHIKGAVSVPLNELNERYREIRREGFAVLY